MAARLSEQAAAIATTEHEVESEERELEIRTRELAVRKRELLQNSTQFEADFAVFLYAIEGAEAAAVAEGQGETEPVLRLVRDEREG
jgi:hypothetical protein